MHIWGEYTDMADKDDYPIDIKIGYTTKKDGSNNPTIRNFRSKEDLANWITEERKFWDLIFGRNTTGSQIQTKLMDSLGALGHQINSVGSNSIKDTIEASFGDNKYLHHGSVQAKWMANMFKANHADQHCIGAYHYFTKNKLITQHHNFVQGYFDALIYAKGINLTNSAKAERNSLEDLRSQFQDLYNQDSKEYDSFKKGYNKTLTAFKSVLKNSDEGIQKNIEANEKKLDEYKLDKENEWNKFVVKVEKKLALNVPANYWNEKAKWHRISAGIFAFVTVAIGFLIFWYLLRGNVVEVEKQLLLKNYAYSGFVVFFLGIYIWILRIFVKITLSHVHLAIDAKERQIMTKTYLALIDQDTDKTMRNDLQIVLQNLFRPSSIGIIKEDSSPPNLPELIARILYKKP